jgi:LPXTG-motif cell wall-anchored protein
MPKTGKNIAAILAIIVLLAFIILGLYVLFDYFLPGGE